MQECLQRQNHSLLGAASETITGTPEFISRPPLVWRFSSWLTKGALNQDALPFYGLLSVRKFFARPVAKIFCSGKMPDAGASSGVNVPVTWRDFRARPPIASA